MSVVLPKIPLTIPFPQVLPKDVPGLVSFLKQMIEQLQAQNQRIASVLNSLSNADLLANRPMVGDNPGDLFYATDNTHLYVWDGTAWQQLV